jgi:hypothetical protein
MAEVCVLVDPDSRVTVVTQGGFSGANVALLTLFPVTGTQLALLRLFEVVPLVAKFSVLSTSRSLDSSLICSKSMRSRYDV